MSENDKAKPKARFSIRSLTFGRGTLHFFVPFIAGMAILLAMRSPEIEASIIGQPDREMMETAFQIRADLVRHLAAPLLLLDIDDESIAGLSNPKAWPAAPAPTAPRGMLAHTLEYVLSAPAGKTPTAVIVDVDIANPTQDVEGVKALRSVLQKWQASESAPLLIFARESLPPSTFGRKGENWILPTSPYDDIVDGGSKIRWAGTRVLADRWGIVRWFQPVECVDTAHGVEPLFSSAILAYRATVHDHIPKDAPVRKWIRVTCKPGGLVDRSEPEGELINYHLSLTQGEEPPVWRDMPKAWPGYRICGQDGGAPLAQVLSTSIIVEAGPDADPGILCRRLVVIGGTNSVAQDFAHTPVKEMAGIMIVANAARGLELSDGGLKRVPLFLQVLTIYIVSTAIWLGFRATESLRRHYRQLRTHVRQRPWLVQLRVLPFNPVILHWLFAFGGYWLGVLLLLRALDQGYWGYLSAPTLAAAMAGLIEEVSEEKEELREELAKDEIALEAFELGSSSEFQEMPDEGI